MKPNVLLIVFDTARADAFSPYGAPADASPVFADLASRGSFAAAARANACWTVPSHAAMFTGLLPRQAGLVKVPGGRPAGSRPVLEGQRDRLLPEVLRRAGYRTSAISTNLWITPDSGFAFGFDDFVTVDTRRQTDMARDSLRGRLGWIAEGVRARADDGADEAADAIREQVPGWAAGEQPFFCFVNLVECHSPYLPPKPYNDLGPIDRARAAAEAPRYLTMNAIWQACAGGLEVPDAALERMRTLYAGAIRRLDAWLGEVLDRLDGAGLLDDTLVIATSDHGENFGEGGMMGHAFSLDERLLRVPLAAAGAGHEKVTAAPTLAALPAAIAAVAELEEHPWFEQPAAAGPAVAEFEPPVGDVSDARIEQALERWGLGRQAAARITTPLATATEGDLKLTRRGEREELYDLASDPLEQSPLGPGAVDPDALAPLREALAVEARAEPAEVADAPEAEADDAELQALEDRMRLLGYM